MALNISPFGQQNPLQMRGAPNITEPTWGPPNMSKQIQEGIASLYKNYQDAYEQKRKLTAQEIAAEEQLKPKSPYAGAAALGAPGGPYAVPPVAPGALPTVQQGGMGPDMPPGTPGAPPTPAATAAGGVPPTPVQPGEIEAHIRASAARRGIDPDVAVRVAQAEGGLLDPIRQSDVRKNGVREPSYGPFQLYMGGGLGNRALERGIDPRNPAQWREAIDFALEEAAKKGWGQWYGAAKAGIGNRQGLNYGGDTGLEVATAGQPNVVPQRPGERPVTENAPAYATPGVIAPVEAYRQRIQQNFPQVKITSDYRSPEQNRAVGGAKGSQHMAGKALDINTSGMSEEQKAALIDDAIANGARGVGWYNPNSMHIDFRESPAAWGPNRSKTSLRATPTWFQERANRLLAGQVPPVQRQAPPAQQQAPAPMDTASPYQVAGPANTPPPQQPAATGGGGTLPPGHGIHIDPDTKQRFIVNNETGQVVGPADPPLPPRRPGTEPPPLPPQQPVTPALTPPAPAPAQTAGPGAPQAAPTAAPVPQQPRMTPEEEQSHRRFMAAAILTGDPNLVREAATRLENAGLTPRKPELVQGKDGQFYRTDSGYPVATGVGGAQPMITLAPGDPLREQYAPGADKRTPILVDPATRKWEYVAAPKVEAPPQTQTAVIDGVLHEKQPDGSWKVVAGADGQQGDRIMPPGDPNRAKHGITPDDPRTYKVTRKGDLSVVEDPKAPTVADSGTGGKIVYDFTTKTWSPLKITGGDGTQPMFSGNSVEAQALNHLVARKILTPDQAADLATGKTVTAADGSHYFFKGSELMAVPQAGATPVLPQGGAPAASGGAPAGAAAPAAPGATPAPQTPPAAPAGQAGTQLTPPKEKEPQILPPEKSGLLSLGNKYINEDLPTILADVEKGVFDTYGVRFATEKGFPTNASSAYRKIQEGREALLRGLTGAAMSESEKIEYADRYLPTWKDSDRSVIRDKLNNLRRSLIAVREGQLAGRRITSEWLTGEVKSLAEQEGHISPGGNSFRETK